MRQLLLVGCLLGCASGCGKAAKQPAWMGEPEFVRSVNAHLPTGMYDGTRFFCEVGSVELVPAGDGYTLRAYTLPTQKGPNDEWTGAVDGQGKVRGFEKCRYQDELKVLVEMAREAVKDAKREPIPGYQQDKLLEGKTLGDWGSDWKVLCLVSPRKDRRGTLVARVTREHDGGGTSDSFVARFDADDKEITSQVWMDLGEKRWEGKTFTVSAWCSKSKQHGAEAKVSEAWPADYPHRNLMRLNGGIAAEFATRLCGLLKAANR